MKTHETKSKKASDNQVGSLLGFVLQIVYEIFRNMNAKNADHWLQRKSLLKKKIQEVFSASIDSLPDVASVINDWQKFYQDHFGLNVDFADIAIPEKPEDGSWRLTCIAGGLTMNGVVAVMRKKFKVYIYNDDLDKNIPTNTRTASKSYAVWVRDGIEPDQKYLGQSIRQADMGGQIGVTVLERLVLELKYFAETGNHLDINGITFCTSSRYADGDVPGVGWSPVSQRVGVSWFVVGNSDSRYGLREAVSA